MSVSIQTILSVVRATKQYLANGESNEAENASVLDPRRPVVTSHRRLPGVNGENG